MGTRLSLMNQHQNETQYGNETTHLTEGNLRSVAGVQRSTKLHIVGIMLHNRSCLMNVGAKPLIFRQRGGASVQIK